MSIRSRLRELDRFDLGVLGALLALSLAFLVWFVGRDGVFAGWEGFVVADQGQYLNWIRQSSEHVLVGNSFDLEPDSHVFLHPTLLLSGLLYLAGLSAPLAYFVWKPVGVVALFYGAWRYTRRTLGGRWERRVALVLGLLFISPAAALAPLWGDSGGGTLDFMNGEIWPAGHLWGYPMTAIAIGLIPLVYLWVERILEGGRDVRREALLAPAAALLICWLHPWQGGILVGVLGLAALWHVRAGEAGTRQMARAVGPTVAAALVPAVYYFLLGRLDDSWARSEENYRIGITAVEPAWLLLALGPLVLAAAFAYRGRVSGVQERFLRLWAPVGILIYAFPPTPVRFHAFNGLSIPLSILAVRALSPHVARAASRPGRRGLVAAAVVAVCAVAVVPGAVDRIRAARGAVYLNQQPFLLDEGERDALEAIEGRPGAGGVLTAVDLGALVPYWTGRETWVGSPSWSPDFGERAGAVGSLFAGGLTPSEARRVVRLSGARFVLQDCRSRADLATQLRPLLRDTRRYGCAAVHELTVDSRTR